jgi:uncharacterized oxidoreductase
MKLTGNTIFITGGGSGIGRGLAEALHKLGNKVIISGRRRVNLEVVTANPGMEAVELDITDPASIDRAAARLIADHPNLNVLFNNAGIMLPDTAAGRVDDKLLVDTVTTNLFGPIRMTSALVDHLKGKKGAVIVYTSSVLGFVPMAPTTVYSATKAAILSYVLSQRFLLKDSGVRVLERMGRMIKENETALQRAIARDFKTASQEYIFETQASYLETEYQKSQLKTWMAPVEAPVPAALAKTGHKGIVYRDPFGVTLIIGPFMARFCCSCVRRLRRWWPATPVSSSSAQLFRLPTRCSLNSCRNISMRVP